MLVQLSICNIVLIDKLDVQFENGLSIFTGETGAGKSILLDSLALALGERGDGSLVREPYDQGQVTAVFDLAQDHFVRSLLRENNFEDEGDIILKRVQFRDGRSRAFINDKPVSISFLREVSQHLVEIHGQHEDRVFTDCNNHRHMLDAYGKYDSLLDEVKKAYQDWQKLKIDLAKQVEKVETTKREGEFLRAAIEELAQLNPQENEEDTLSHLRVKMHSLEKIATEIHEAEEVLSGSQSVLPPLTSLWRRLDRKVEQAPEFITPITDALAQALDHLGYAQDHIAEAIRNLGFDPSALEQTEERLFALRAASRKYQCPADELHLLKLRYEADLAQLDANEVQLQQLQAQLTKAEAHYDHLASLLSQRRRETALVLRQEILQELPELKLEKADFLINFTTDSNHRRIDGIDILEFWVQTNPGTKPGPLMKVASGGELSRFLLALKVVLTDKMSAFTLVFDEIDTGVGGAVAAAIGNRLSRLARKLQVLSITHAPQVAAYAHKHFLIEKHQNPQENTTITKISSLNEKDRVEEIARMFSGSSITEEARAAAKKLVLQN